MKPSLNISLSPLLSLDEMNLHGVQGQESNLGPDNSAMPHLAYLSRNIFSNGGTYFSCYAPYLAVPPPTHVATPNHIDHKL